MNPTDDKYIKGRGAQLNTKNSFLKKEYVSEHIEGLDEAWVPNAKTQYLTENAKSLVNKVDSADLGFMYSMNPYQGCEHGCLYCFARTTHEYYGYSAGLDFETKILVKKNAAQLLRATFEKPSWKPGTILLSGNTDCYQPIERKLQITRSLLEVCLEYRNPVSIITKNSLILRDLDVLQELQKLNLVMVSVSITSLDEKLRQLLEPRTTTAAQRLKTVELLTQKNIPVNVMIAPVIPSLNSQEIPAIIKAVAERGATSVHYTIVRLNGEIASVFEDWVHKNFPDRASKILHQIAECHGGQLGDTRPGLRMSGEGNTAKAIKDLFQVSVKKCLAGRVHRKLSTDLFLPRAGKQLGLF